MMMPLGFGLMCILLLSCNKTSYPCPAIETPAEAQLRKQDPKKKNSKKKKSTKKYDQNGRLIKKSYTHSGLKK